MAKYHSLKKLGNVFMVCRPMLSSSEPRVQIQILDRNRNLLCQRSVLEVCGSTRTRGYTRTRPVPAGMGRVWVDLLRVGSGTGTKSTGRVPVFTRKEHHFTRCWSYIECFCFISSF